MCTQQNAHLIPGFAFFNDTMRDAIRGSVFDARVPGLASGDLGRSNTFRNCFTANPGWTNNPVQLINYESCHDNYTLYDALSTALPNADRGELVRRNLLAAAMMLLSQGIPLLHAGEEMLRSKPGTRKGTFTQNSYRSPDRTNSLKWDQLQLPEVQAAIAYYKGLISLRKKYPQFRMHTSQEINGCVNQHAGHHSQAISYILYGKEDRLLVVFNPTESAVHIPLPSGAWDILVRDQQAGCSSLGTVQEAYLVSPISALVLVQSKH